MSAVRMLFFYGCRTNNAGDLADRLRCRIAGSLSAVTSLAFPGINGICPGYLIFKNSGFDGQLSGEKIR